jgi:hypothetical protein
MLELLFVICAIVGSIFIVLGLAGVLVQCCKEYRLFRRRKKMMAEYTEASRRG